MKSIQYLAIELIKLIKKLAYYNVWVYNWEKKWM